MRSFVVVGDVHAREDNPQSRIDNTMESLLNKLEWVIDYTNKNADFVVFLGDLGERPIWSTRLVNRTVKVLNECTKPMYTLIGNHDIKNYNNDRELFEDTGLYRVLQNTPLEILTEKMYTEFTLYGYSTGQDNLEDFVQGKIEVPRRSYMEILDTFPENPTPVDIPKHTRTHDHLNIAFAHYPVGQHESQWMKDHKKLNLPGFNMAFFGDIHDGFEPYTLKNGCIVANPGALLRKSKNEINRCVNIFHVTGLEIKTIEVPHRKGEEVFTSSIDNLYEVPIPGYMDDDLIEGENMTETIRNIGKELNLKEETINYVVHEYERQQFSRLLG